MKVMGFLAFLVVSHFGVLQVFRLTTWHRYFAWAWPLLVLYAALVGWTLFKLGLAEFSLYQVVLASLWLFIVGRHQSNRGDTMVKLATADADAAHFISGSVAKTKRYYAYSAFMYVGALCMTYVVAGGGIPVALFDPSEDPLVRPLVAWLSSLSASSLIAVVGGVYLVVGLMMGADQVSRGVYGTRGPGCTLVAWSLLWPFAGYYRRMFSRRGPSRQLKTISQRLGAESDPRAVLEELKKSMDSATSGVPRTRQQAKEDLYALCEGGGATGEVMRRFEATRATLREVYDRLTVGGASQWAGGHWVAASALAYPDTLEFVLRYLRGIHAMDSAYPWPVDLRSDRPEVSVGIRIAYQLIEYFENGRTGPVA